MSPYPAQVDREQIVDTAWELVETRGLDQLSLGNLASELGIKAPSLYRHIKNKAGLLQAINELTQQRLIDHLVELLSSIDARPLETLTAVAYAYRTFAHDHPVTYMLWVTTVDPDSRPDPIWQEQTVIPLQEAVAKVSGEARSLSALHGLWAFLNGFVMLELNKQFRLEGDLDAAFSDAVEAWLRGWSVSD
jgi:AcrR family transcriptional regulator